MKQHQFIRGVLMLFSVRIGCFMGVNNDDTVYYMNMGKENDTTDITRSQYEQEIGKYFISPRLFHARQNRMQI